MKNAFSEDQRSFLNDFISSPLCKESYENLAKKITVNDVLETLIATENQNDISLIIEATKRFITLGIIDDVLIDNEESIEILRKGSVSKDASIRLLIAYIIHSLSNNTKTCKKLCENGLYLAIGTLIKDKDISIGESASKTLKQIANNFPEYVYSDPLISIIKSDFRSLKDETRLRILDSYISIGSISEELFELCQKKSDIYLLALKEYFTDDILLKLVSIKLLEDMGEYKWGVEFIVRNSTPELLIKDLVDPMFDDDIKISIVYLISKIINNHPEMSNSVLNMLNKSFLNIFKEFMLSYSQNNDLNRTICAINSWGLFSIRYSSFQSLISEWEGSIQKMLEYLKNSNSDISLTSLNSWVVLFESSEIKDIINNLKTSFNFKKSIEDQLIPTLLTDIISKPFPENRTLIYRLLTLMIPHFSCVTSGLCSNSKLRELILNSNSDFNKDLLYVKYDMIKQIMKYDKEVVKSLSDEHFYRSMEEYVGFGPFYKSQSAEMRVQDSTM
ncbi:hypothetical protein FG386_001933 [Cryptosporidium ryanae]|uniref:uncharacterized protein n=1 Tax=Cryptosporidium ryanae TaxID=515981 RepID=UPI00351A236A|nr:hypothetical protein FG386_001933 [Cryptosporidium ryanae]